VLGSGGRGKEGTGVGVRGGGGAAGGPPGRPGGGVRRGKHVPAVGADPGLRGGNGVHWEGGGAGGVGWFGGRAGSEKLKRQTVAVAAAQ